MRDSEIRELDSVTLAVAVEAWEGQKIAAGTSGTVVSISANGMALLVEFDGATGLLADIQLDQIAAHVALPNERSAIIYSYSIST